MRFSVLLAVCVMISKVNAINWQPGNWAFACDFRKDSFSNEQIQGEDCGGRCVQTVGCTHFTWTTHNEGTCWMKTGNVSKENAFETRDLSMVCGIVEKATESNSGPDSNPKVSEVNFTGGGDDCALPHFKLLLISLSIVRYLTCN